MLAWHVAHMSKCTPHPLSSLSHTVLDGCSTARLPSDRDIKVGTSFNKMIGLSGHTVKRDELQDWVF